MAIVRASSALPFLVVSNVLQACSPTSTINAALNEGSFHPIVHVSVLVGVVIQPISTVAIESIATVEIDIL